jgi:hypothetical protein
MSWQQVVVGRLIELRAQDGPDFERHWTATLKLYPPTGRDVGPARPTLFDEQGRAAHTLIGFFKRVCDNAYHDRVGPKGSGNGPALRHFRADILHALDDSGPTHKTRRATRRAA